MKKILIFNDGMQFGGAEILLLNILKHLSDKSCKITLLLPFPDERNVLLKEAPDSVEVRYVHPQRLSRSQRICYDNLMAFFPVLFSKIRRLDLKKYDLLVSFKDSPYANLFPPVGLPAILWIHNLLSARDYHIASPKEFIPVHMQKARANRLHRSFCSFGKVVFVSHATKNSYINVFDEAKRNKPGLYVVYNTVDFSKIKELSREPLRWSMEQHPVFALAARFSVEKRIDRVVSAAKRLKDEGYRFQVVIMGEGKTFEDVKRQVTALSLTDEVVLTGYTANPYPCIKASDWLICCSEKESFSLVVIESIYLGTPVITTDCGGPTEISDNGKYALLTENSSEGVYWGMKKALDNSALADSYTSLAGECLQRFDYDKWLKDTEKILLGD